MIPEKLELTVFKFHYPIKGYVCNRPGDNTGYYVTINDYERLFADNARLKAELDNLRAQLGALAAVTQ